MRAILLRHADSAVAHLQDGLFFFPRVLKTNFAACRCVFNAVVNQCAQQLPNQHSVCEQGFAFRRDGDGVLVLRVDECLLLQQFVKEQPHGESRGGNMEFTAVASGKKEQVIDEVVHIGRLLLQHADAILQNILILTAPAGEQVYVALHDGKRCAQFVRYICDETPLLPIGGGDAVEHAVDRGCEVSEFVVWFRHLQTLVQRLAVDTVCGGDHLADGFQHAPARALTCQQRDQDTGGICAKQQNAKQL